MQYVGFNQKLLDAKWKLQKQISDFHGMQLWFEGYVTDLSTGKIVQHKKSPSYSWCKAMAQAMAVQRSNGLMNETITEIDDTTTVFAASNAACFRSDGATGSNQKGLVVGTGSGAESINNNKMTTLVVHGNGAGQLQYGADSFTAVSVSGTQAFHEQSRVFTANLVDTVNVTEVGLCGQLNTIATAPFTLNARDLQSYTVAVGQTLTLTARTIWDNA